MNKQIKKLVEKNPNDQSLGEEVRELYWSDKSNNQLYYTGKRRTRQLRDSKRLMAIAGLGIVIVLVYLIVNNFLK